MQFFHQTTDPAPRMADGAWRLLQGVAASRLLITAALALLAHFPDGAPILAVSGNSTLLQHSILAAGLASFIYLGVTLAKWPGKPRFHALLQVVVDTLLITLLVHYTGGQHSPLNALYLLAVVSAAFLLGGHSAFYLAWVILGLTFLLALLRLALGLDQRLETAPLWVFGLALVAIAVLADNLASRLRRSEQLLAERGSEILSLNALNNEIIQHMDLGVLVVSEENRVLLTNPVARTMTGYPEWSEVRLPIDVVSPTLLSFVIQCRLGKPRSVDPVVLKSRRHEERLVKVHCVPLAEQTQGPILMLLADVSQDQAREQQAQLAALGRLTANIAHEIRNPLSAVSHAAQLLHERLLDTQVRRLSHIIVRETDRLNQIVESVLELGSPRPPQIEDFAVRPWIQQVMEHLRQDPAHISSNLHLYLAEPELRLRADPAQLQQVLWNLVRNATHYGHRDQEEAIIEIHAKREDDQHGSIAVRDHGPGVPAALARRIFEPFFTTSSRGTGLGLNIVRDLVTHNQGRIKYSTHPQGGAVFKVILPLAGPEPATRSGGPLSDTQQQRSISNSRESISS
ncbi:MAG: two-component system sensor histidine kinase NtrB [Pseudomonadota bacterium]